MEIWRDSSTNSKFEKVEKSEMSKIERLRKVDITSKAGSHWAYEL